MSHKVHPKIFRIGSIYTWDSKWFSRKNYAKFLREDLAIRAYLMKEFKDVGMDSIGIERTPHDITVSLSAAKPGMIIGRGGAGAEELRKKVQKKFFDIKTNVKVNILEVSRPALSATIIGQSVVIEIEKRVPFRRVLKQAVERARKAGALGVKIAVSGRLNGAEIARREFITEGKIPLQNLRSDIDFNATTAHTIYGVIGIKVWVYRGDIFASKEINK
ncbi:MAG: 30S ribosomal protein S3 [Candidatus Magasanikbacteria bacterium GW2011_GWA2_45_39]|uniref:Small ribosomal subunit protein uS3 n=2 Tax=Candidatus Magasanikiibacteriota TaxID=1752731 RepID=A0A0G1MYT1_9BACT|nr:MAG: 30S ribosomal protein S3 [Candidatus Magasanikbacteria bacterium GW2011_GWA2_45_39]KKU13252.1 MAG: 30S ribosomal protein S3 [Candidatus Magasanikbacteria bacterium GW2011_GWC2_45_8]HBW73678.1 30S ribosomal protein S3 [Candidatus Magasanikbacteria bacterium]